MLQLFFLASLLIGVFSQECGKKVDQPGWPMKVGENGKLQSKIVGGRNSYPEIFWPWQLSLQFLREGTTDVWGHTCGASLISIDWALTAAHCVTGRMVGLNDTRRDEPENFRLIAGTNNIASFTSGSQILFIDLIVKHERWIPNPYLGYPNDIALLRLVAPANLNPNVELACIPQDTYANFTNEECWITGWGKMDSRDNYIPAILQEAVIDSISNEVCNELNFGYIRDTHICAGTGFPNACSGDSGGPMNCRKDGTWYVTGLASWTSATCSAIPAVYTRVSSFWEWILYTQTINSVPAIQQ